MLRDVGHGRAFDARGRVVPPDAPAGAVRAGVERVTAVERQVDPPDEGDAVVDHDRLLVVRVPDAGAPVHGAPDARVPNEVLAHVAHVAPRRPERRHGSALPEEHADVDPLGELREQVADDHRLLFARELEVGRDEPAGHVDV